jgi:hypothetical protein
VRFLSRAQPSGHDFNCEAATANRLGIRVATISTRHAAAACFQANRVRAE